MSRFVDLDPVSKFSLGMAYYFILFCCGSGFAWIRFDLASMDTGYGSALVSLCELGPRLQVLPRNGLLYYFILFCCGSGSACIRFDLASMDTGYGSALVSLCRLGPRLQVLPRNGLLLFIFFVDPDPHGSALIWLLWIRIRIGLTWWTWTPSPSSRCEWPIVCKQCCGFRMDPLWFDSHGYRIGYADPNPGARKFGKKT